MDTIIIAVCSCDNSTISFRIERRFWKMTNRAQDHYGSHEAALFNGEEVGELVLEGALRLEQEIT
ncbi:17642_t:CDS:2, partial [Acaulospora colombiana]